LPSGSACEDAEEEADGGGEEEEVIITDVCIGSARKTERTRGGRKEIDRD
jgi:hypothetical protein